MWSPWLVHERSQTVTQTRTILEERSGGLLGSEPKDTKSTPLLMKKRNDRSANCEQPEPQDRCRTLLWPGPRPADQGPAILTLTSIILPIMPGQCQPTHLFCKGQPWPRVPAWVCRPGHSLPHQHHSHRYTHRVLKDLHSFKCLLHALYSSWNILLPLSLSFISQLFLLQLPAKMHFF